MIDYKCEPRGLKPIFECDEFVAFDKPSGILSHPSGRNSPYNMYDEIWSLYGQDACVAHRLDLETSGVLIVAKDKNAARKLKDRFEQRSVMKRYIALVRGDLRRGSRGRLQGKVRNGAREDRGAPGLDGIRGSKFAYETASMGGILELEHARASADGASGGFGFETLSGGAGDKFILVTTTGDTGGVYEACALTTAKSVPDTLGVNLEEFEPARYAKFSEKLKFLEGFKGFVIDAPIAPSGEFADIKIRMKIAADGKEAITLIRPLKYFSDIDASLIECYPLTGRQHQIRLHLFHVEHSILGEPLYGLMRPQVEKILDKKMSETGRILTTGAPRLLLHADEICFKFDSTEYKIKSKFDVRNEFYKLAKIDTNLA
nr:RluA family pseudouridine synthase [uncultured Campylobacter sp.]